MVEPVEVGVAETPRRRAYARRVAKWTLGLVAALLVLIVAAVVVLNTPIGQRALTERIAAQTLPNGLNIRIGRIEGDLYGKAVLHDVRLYDLKGLFATVPRAEVDWRPTAWLRDTLDIRSFAARRATLLRVPTFRPGDPDAPFLPGFDALKFGAGVGLRYATGFGPLRLDVGFPLNPEPEDSFVAVYVSLGQAF